MMKTPCCTFSKPSIISFCDPLITDCRPRIWLLGQYKVIGMFRIGQTSFVFMVHAIEEEELVLCSVIHCDPTDQPVQHLGASGPLTSLVGTYCNVLRTPSQHFNSYDPQNSCHPNTSFCNLLICRSSDGITLGGLFQLLVLAWHSGLFVCHQEVSGWVISTTDVCAFHNDQLLNLCAQHLHNTHTALFLWIVL